jgi:molybdate transport system permease protein
LTITLPLAMPGIMTGLILAFARSLGEFGATVTFVGNVAGETRTLPLAIYTYTQIPGADGTALRLVVLSLLLALGALLVSEIAARRVGRLLGR